ncbi:MAG: acyl-CoA dehydrogenase family protein [Thermodesulfobacteriota bacterium]|nr:acyl-CoA dehydrogenase family protein [Thermodesulfobacteriota bacterium]
MIRLSEEQMMVRDMVSRLAKERIRPIAIEAEKKHRFNPELLKIFHENGLLGLCLPVELGGGNADLTTCCLTVEELSYVDGSVGCSYATHTTGVHFIVEAASQDQKERYYRKISEQGAYFGVAFTELNAGSDAASIRTRAIRAGEKYIINGNKIFIGNAGVAHVFMVFVVTEPGKRDKGISTFIVDRDIPGLSFGKEEEKMAVVGSSMRELIFDNAEVQAENLLGSEGEGFTIAMNEFNKSRLLVAAMAVGLARSALDEAVTYAKQRQQFGKSISEFQGIQFMIADMAMNIEAAKRLAYTTSQYIDESGVTKELAAFSSMSKCFASDMAMRVTTDAVQILGGYGIMKEYSVERMMRDAKTTQIIEGTNEIQRIIIARSALRG